MLSISMHNSPFHWILFSITESILMDKVLQMKNQSLIQIIPHHPHKKITKSLPKCRTEKTYDKRMNNDQQHLTIIIKDTLGEAGFLST